MLWSDVIRAVLVALLLLTTGAVTPAVHLPLGVHLAALYVTVLLMSTCTAFFQPARTAIIQEIVVPGQRPHATSIAMTVRSLARIIGPPLAAPLLFGLGIQWALMVDALSFVGSFAAILAVRARSHLSAEDTEPSSIVRDFRAGLKFYAENRVLRVVTLAVVLVMLGAGATSALSVFFLVENLHTPASFFGFLGTANAAGVLIGAVLGTAVVKRLGMERTFSTTLFAIGITILLYSRVTVFSVALAVNVIIGLTAGILNVPVIPMILAVTPGKLAGRVFAVFSPLADTASLVSVVVAGYLVSLVAPGMHTHLGILVFGRVDTVFAVSGLLSLIAGIYAYVALPRAATPPEKPQTI